MNKYFEKYVQTLSHRNISLVFSIIYIFLVFGLFYILLEFGQKYTIFATIFLVLLTFLYLKVYKEFRKRQILWLKVNGAKIVTRYSQITRGLPSKTGRTPWFIWVESDVFGKKLKFKSDSVHYGREKEVFKGDFSSTRSKLEKQISEYQIDHPGISVFINKSNPNVYWVDTDFL